MIVRRVLAAVVCSAFLIGCTAPTDAPTPSPRSSALPISTASASIGAVRRTVDALAAAVERQDRAGFTALTSSTDPAFGNRVRMLFDNLTGLGLDQLRFRPDPRTVPLTGARAEVFGGRAWRQPVQVEWRLTGETATATHTLWMTFTTEPDGVRLAGVVDQPADLGPQPLWWLTPVEAERSDDVIVIVAAGQSARRWIDRSVAAARTVTRELPAPLDASWTGAVTVEAPATATEFEHLLGAQPGTRTETSAVTQLDGANDRAALRVIVNPRAAETLTEAQLTRVLAHEFVHVASASPASAAPQWAVEGLAEWVSLRATPGAQSYDTDRFLRQVRRSGPPRTPPADADFAAGGARTRLAYAEAWLLCRYLADRDAPRRLGELYLDLDRGDPLDQASPAVLGRSESQLMDGWRRHLTRLAER